MAAGPSILRMERWNYGLGAVSIALAAITQPQAISLGFTVGVLLTCLNFFFLRKLVVKWTADAAAGKPGKAPILILPKMVGMMGAVAVVVLFLPINVIAFIVGYSIFMVSIVAETIYSALRPQPDAEPSEHKHG
ncbi:MAG TPA: ATP synthase subunit I [Kofleriaceae bacterium]|nr:ATP synthase subunit I [Kofleriaceae bacterium]